MSCDEKDCKVIVDEVVVKKKKRQYLPKDIEYNTKHYHKNVAPVTCDICGTTVVNRALYFHKTSNKCKLVTQCIEMERLKYELAALTKA
jgi:hypothetical protein